MLNIKWLKELIYMCDMFTQLSSH